MHHKFFLTFAAAYAGSCYAKVTAKDAASSLDTITENISDLEVLVDSISKENATDTTAIQSMVDSYRDIVIKQSGFGDAFVGEPAFTSSQQDPICTSITKSSEQHALLLDALIAKYELFDDMFRNVGAQLLLQDEKSADEMAFYVLGLAPDCKKAAINDLSKKFTKAITKYQPEEEL